MSAVPVNAPPSDPTNAQAAPIVVATGISKAFPGVQAVDASRSSFARARSML